MSLYAPINKNAEWKLSSSAESVWKEASFVDASWTSVTLGSITQQLIEPSTCAKPSQSEQHDRHRNRSEVSLCIIAYINGQQVYRDNMPEGEVSSATSAIGGYSSYDYRGVYRSAAVASTSHSVLALELHFIHSTPNTLDFNASLALYAVSAATVAPLDSIVTSTTVRDNSVSWTHSSSTMVGGPGTMTFTNTGFPRMVSSLRI